MSTETMSTTTHGSPEVMPGSHFVSAGSPKNVSDHSETFLLSPGNESEYEPKELHRIEWLDQPESTPEPTSASREKVNTIFQQRDSGLKENNFATSRNLSPEPKLAELEQSQEKTKQEFAEHFEELDHAQLEVEDELDQHEDFDWLWEKEEDVLLTEAETMLDEPSPEENSSSKELEESDPNPELQEQFKNVISTTESTLLPEEQYLAHKEELTRLVELYIEHKDTGASDTEHKQASFTYEHVHGLEDLQLAIDDQMVQCTLAKKLWENQDDLEKYASEVEKTYPGAKVNIEGEEQWAQINSKIEIVADRSGELSISITRLSNPYEQSNENSGEAVQGNLAKSTHITSR
jgi:hypothetical protein